MLMKINNTMTVTIKLITNNGRNNVNEDVNENQQ